MLFFTVWPDRGGFASYEDGLARLRVHPAVATEIGEPPTTRYRDYPLAADLFHWESQNSTSLASSTGRRYLTGDSRILLFVRAARKDDLGSAPCLCLGEATLVEHHGERPIAITWRLHRPMPSEVLQDGAIASG